jgi:hypothetical protein
MKYHFTQAIVASNPRHGMPKRKLSSSLEIRIGVTANPCRRDRYVSASPECDFPCTSDALGILLEGEL